MLPIMLAVLITTVTPQDWAKSKLETKHPKWKTTILENMSKGKYTEVRARFTRYSDLDYLDGATGGGPECYWGTTTRLKWGMCAAAPCWKRGTVFYSPQLEMLLIVTDRGPGVQSKSHFDVYCPDIDTWNLCGQKLKGSVLYKVGYVSRKDYFK